MRVLICFCNQKATAAKIIKEDRASVKSAMSRFSSPRWTISDGKKQHAAPNTPPPPPAAAPGATEGDDGATYEFASELASPLAESTYELASPQENSMRATADILAIIGVGNGNDIYANGTIKGRKKNRKPASPNPSPINHGPRHADTMASAVSSVGGGFMQKAFEARMAANANATNAHAQAHVSRRQSAAILNNASLFSMVSGDGGHQHNQRRVTFAGAATSQIVPGGGEGEEEHTYERLVVVQGNGDDDDDDDDNCSTVDATMPHNRGEVYPMSTWADAIDAKQEQAAANGLATRQDSQESGASSEHYCLRTITDGMGSARGKGTLPNVANGPRDLDDEDIYSTANM